MRAVERSGACNASVSWYRGNASLRCNQLNPHTERSEHPVIRQVGDQAGCSVLLPGCPVCCVSVAVQLLAGKWYKTAPHGVNTPQTITLGLSSYWV